MTNEEKRIAIAEACGWTDIRTPSDKSYYQIDMETLAWLMGRVAGIKPGERVHKMLPDYPSDRDAMIEAIKTLPPEQQRTVAELLCGDLVEVMLADAKDLADAFLKTIGKLP